MQVLAFPKDKNFVHAKIWTRKSTIGGIFEIYTQIKKGKYPVFDAFVEARVTSPDGKRKFRLFDNTNSNGIYKKYFTPSLPGFYKIEVVANDNGLTSFIEIGQNLKLTKQPGEIIYFIIIILKSFKYFLNH